MLIADPGRVEQDVIAQMTNFIDHLTGVINGAVIGAQLNDRQAERSGFIGALRRDLADLLA
ncbi:hypothetical protein D3C76_1881460 [compost metagenome]